MDITTYYWMGDVLQGEQKARNQGGQTVVDYYILYLYDENGTMYGFLYKTDNVTEYYYYIFNAQGDVIGILNSAGTKVVEYTYSAWGEVLSITGTKASTIGQTNPIRYRGYYYDNETGFYYLQSRYYDTTTQRFINSDKYASTGQGILGFNMFMYCGNDPVNCCDCSGECWHRLWIFGDCARCKAKNHEQLSNAVELTQNLATEANNPQSTHNRIVDNQNEDIIKQIKYGVKYADYNGCEAIAIHNVRVIKGQDSSVSEVISDIRSAGGMWLLGRWGSKPSSIPKLLKKYGISYTKVKPKNMVLKGTYIMSYINKGGIKEGIHTVAVTYNGSEYTAINGPKNFEPTEYECICVYYLE